MRKVVLLGTRNLEAMSRSTDWQSVRSAVDGVDDEYSPNPRYMDAVQVLDAFRNTGSKMCLLL